ncbi:MAG TPA: lipid-A-disaccharide synthase [Steroidobacteraceae bacterium]|nr:lipid-A-disaccharide synthase [Steroidobacteraceae bacterium]
MVGGNVTSPTAVGEVARSAGEGAVALVAGEASGDNLGGALIRALRARAPGARCLGVAGPRMREAGCEAWHASEELAVMGLAEILKHLPRLLRLRRRLVARLLAERPDVFVGIDSPEFNLRVAAQLKARGIPTVQYVSPQVWAWRQGRVRTIGQAVDLVLCVLPFESRFYDEHHVRAVFVGHPLADRVPLESPPEPARLALGLALDRPVVAVLPGSRRAEVGKLGAPFAATLAWLHARRPELQFVAPMANELARATFERALAEHAPGVEVRLVDGRAPEALTASDAVLVASGTATLEAALVKRPMVVAYRVAPLTSWLLRDLRLMKAEFFAQPNLLAGRRIVPEVFQEQVRPDVLGPAMLEQLERPDRAELIAAFTAIHHALRRDASARAAEAILELRERRRMSA